MKTYQEQKKDWINSLSPQEQEKALLYTGQAELMIEAQIRSNIGTLASFIQALGKMVDTKKDSVRQDILDFITNNPDTMKQVKDNIGLLINITRI